MESSSLAFPSLDIRQASWQQLLLLRALGWHAFRPSPDMLSTHGGPFLIHAWTRMGTTIFAAAIILLCEIAAAQVQNCRYACLIMVVVLADMAAGMHHTAGCKQNSGEHK